MAKQTRDAGSTKTRTRAHRDADRGETTTTYLHLAAEALLDGWTREQVITALIGRIKRDQGYLAYRKACNRRTSYDTRSSRTCGHWRSPPAGWKSMGQNLQAGPAMSPYQQTSRGETQVGRSPHPKSDRRCSWPVLATT